MPYFDTAKMENSRHAFQAFLDLVTDPEIGLLIAKTDELEEPIDLSHSFRQGFADCEELTAGELAETSHRFIANYSLLTERDEKASESVRRRLEYEVTRRVKFTVSNGLLILSVGLTAFSLSDDGSATIRISTQTREKAELWIRRAGMAHWAFRLSDGSEGNIEEALQDSFRPHTGMIGG